MDVDSAGMPSGRVIDVTKNMKCLLIFLKG